MMEDSLSLRGAPVRPLPRANRTWGTGRVCAEEGCTTKLSIYNKSKYCYAHQPIGATRTRGQRSVA